MAGHHALLFEVAGGVVVVAAALGLSLRKKKKAKVVEELTSEDMQRIDNRLTTADVGRTESRFRRRYGVDAREKDFAKPKPPVEPTEKAPDEPTA